MSDYWKDYILHRPGTPGGEQARLEASRARAPSFPSVRITDPVPPALSPPRPARKLTKLDLVVGVVVFIVAWAALSRSVTGEVWGAAAIAFFAGAIATRWWRPLLVLGIFGIALIAYFHSK
jgi:hypothetical protein